MASVYSANNAAGYEQLMGRWSRRLAPLFIDFADVSDATRVLDVGCGTGSLSFALMDALPQARITGLDYSQAFIDYASSKAPADGRLVFKQGDAVSLPYDDQAFDAALSLLVLNFVPDAQKAARELVRVTRSGGVVAASVWDFKGGVISLRVLADTAAALVPSGEAFRGRVFSGPFTGPGEFASTWAEMGLHEVVQTSLTIRMEFTSFADYWEPMLAGQGTAGAYVQSLTNEQRSLIEHHLRLAYCAGDKDGPRSFAAIAWACRGIR
jgi:SAM-dependent methyltransferase